jgi:hypothetical protein
MHIDDAMFRAPLIGFSSDCPLPAAQEEATNEAVPNRVVHGFIGTTGQKNIQPQIG